MSPGPNNTIIMAMASRRGLAAAIPACIAIATSSAIMILPGSIIINAAPAGQMTAAALQIGGAVMLAVFTIRTLCGSPGAELRLTSPTGIGMIIAFQPLNPKAWLLSVTIAAAAHAHSEPIVMVATLVALISAASLLAWAQAGVVIDQKACDAHRRLWFARILSTAMLASAAAMLFTGIEELI